MKQSIKKILYDNLVFLIPWFVLSILILLLISTSNPLSLHLQCNAFHTPLLDVFFKIITYLADGVTVAFVFVFILVFNIRNSFLIGISGILSGLIAQILKHTVFDNVMRPSAFLDKMPGLELVEGVKMHLANSFPSGHATSAFALFFALSIISRNIWLKLLWFFIAVLVAYSRVYLSQHFLEDILAGATLGLIITFAVSILIQSKAFNWAERPLFKPKK